MAAAVFWGELIFEGRLMLAHALKNLIGLIIRGGLIFRETG